MMNEGLQNQEELEWEDIMKTATNEGPLTEENENTEVLTKNDLRVLEGRVRRLEKRKESRCSNGSIRFQNVEATTADGKQDGFIPQRRRVHYSINRDFQRRILLNVGGIRFETFIKTLQRIPDTRLSRLADAHEDDSNEEYFFDRNPGVFQSVLDFYRTGELHYPLHVCGALSRRELKFWEIDEGTFSSCCVTKFSKFTDNAEILADLRRNLEYKPANYDNDEISAWTRMKGKMWHLMNKPRSSLLAMIYAVIVFMSVGLSLAIQCTETMSIIQREVNITIYCSGHEPFQTTAHFAEHWLRWTDLALAIFFTLELIIKVICAPNKDKYFRHPMTIIDFLACLPSYIIQFVYMDTGMCFMKYVHIIETVMMLRILRVFRIFHILRHYGPFRVLLYSVKSTFNAMVMLIVFLGVSVMFFGALIYYAEREAEDTEFPDLPSGFWWAIVTMTTVGYGDRTPNTAFGYTIGAVVAVSGLVILALVIPIISNAFTALYNFDVAMKNVHTHSKIRRRRKTLSVNNAVQLTRLKQQGSRVLRRSIRKRKGTKTFNHSDSVQENTDQDITDQEMTDPEITDQEQETCLRQDRTDITSAGSCIESSI